MLPCRVLLPLSSFHLIPFTERRPLKATMPIPLFRSPSSRLNTRDMMEDDRGRSVDGLNLTSSLEGSHNEALHYSFMPNKQIVSLPYTFISHPLLSLCLVNMIIRLLS